MNITRRDALRGAAAIAAAGAVPISAMAGARPTDPLRVGVQALVDEIRRDLGEHITVQSMWALHQAADRLEALPGIQTVHNEYWGIWRRDFDRRFGPVRVLRPCSPEMLKPAVPS